MVTAERRPLGATPLEGGRTHFRVWAPDHRQVQGALAEGRGLRKVTLPLEGNGYFSGSLETPVGSRYRYCLSEGDCFPDPCSRFQPEGSHGPSEVVDLGAHRWADTAWRGLSSTGQVLYELQVGTFSPEGTYEGVEARLGHLRDLGVTALLLMPLATFPGRHNWGYDGVCLFAPCAVYGRPEALQRLVDAAHSQGLGVVVDVVYNHLGPDGNCLGHFARGYFSRRYQTDWGLPFHVEGEEGAPVRDLIVQNARMWVERYHVDGFRLDATQNVYDASPRHILTELIAEARAAAGDRSLLIISENQPQDRRTILPEENGGHGGDLLWVDDFHHSARVALTGNAEAYCQDYCGTSRELLSCVLRNSLYQGQYYDHPSPELMKQVHRGRDGFLSQFATARHALEAEGHEVPIDAHAFYAYRLDWAERDAHAPVLALHQQTLRLRREDPLISAGEGLAGATLSERALVLRWQGPRLEDTRLLVLNLGPDLALSPCPEPLLAPPPGRRWRLLLSSQETKYGGRGADVPRNDGPWRVSGHCAQVLTPEERTDERS